MMTEVAFEERIPFQPLGYTYKSLVWATSFLCMESYNVTESFTVRVRARLRKPSRVLLVMPHTRIGTQLQELRLPGPTLSSYCGERLMDGLPELLYTWVNNPPDLGVVGMTLCSQGYCTAHESPLRKYRPWRVANGALILTFNLTMDIIQ